MIVAGGVGTDWSTYASVEQLATETSESAGLAPPAAAYSAPLPATATAPAVTPTGTPDNDCLAEIGSAAWAERWLALSAEEQDAEKRHCTKVWRNEYKGTSRGFARYWQSKVTMATTPVPGLLLCDST